MTDTTHTETDKAARRRAFMADAVTKAMRSASTRRFIAIGFRTGRGGHFIVRRSDSATTVHKAAERDGFTHGWGEDSFVVVDTDTGEVVTI